MAETVTLNPSQAAGASSLARYAVLTLAATGLVALCAHIAVPLLYTPVPVTLQTLAVLFLGLLMGPRWAFATLTLYLVEGASGLPVFSPHGPGGLLQLFGFTGGYLLAYPFAAAAAGWSYRLLTRQTQPSFAGLNLLWAMVSAFVASLLILTAGAAWFAFATHQPAHAVLQAAVIPFLAGDIVKACLAAALLTGVRGVLHPHVSAAASPQRS